MLKKTFWINISNIIYISWFLKYSNLMANKYLIYAE